MIRSRLAPVSALAVLALAACDAPSHLASPASSAAFSASSNSAGNSNDNQNEDDSGNAKAPGTRAIFEIRSSSKVSNAASKGGSGTGIYFHGGRVLQSGASIAAVYWTPSTTVPIYTGGPVAGATGSSTGTGLADGSLVGLFMSNLGGSPYYNINSTYTDGAGRKLDNTLKYTGYWATTANAPGAGVAVTDAQMVALLQSGFDSGNLAYDPNRIYAIFSAGTANLGGGFGTQYCAYHTNGVVTIGGVRQTVLYAAMPYDYAYPSACSVFNSTTKPANGDAGADAEVSVLAHEIEETATDALGSAWYDRLGSENADKCAWTYGTTFTTSLGGTANMTIGNKPFLVQRNWVNSGSGGCVLSY